MKLEDAITIIENHIKVRVSYFEVLGVDDFTDDLVKAQTCLLKTVKKKVKSKTGENKATHKTEIAFLTSAVIKCRRDMKKVASENNTSDLEDKMLKMSLRIGELESERHK